MMDPKPPLGSLRDSVAWPVLPVTSVLPPRKIQDLEPFTQSNSSARATPESNDREQAVPQSGEDRSVVSYEAERSTLAAIMSRDVVTIAPEATAAELEALLYHHRVSGAPVVDSASGELLGVASQADVIRHFSLTEEGSNSSSKSVASYHDTLWFDIFAAAVPVNRKQTPVRDFMTPYVYFATETATIEEALDLMLEHHIHRVVVTRNKRLVGVVTSMDLLRSYRSSLRPDDPG